MRRWLPVNGCFSLRAAFFHWRLTTMLTGYLAALRPLPATGRRYHPPPAPAPPPGGVSFLQQERVRPTPVQRIINHTTAARAFVSSPLLLSCGLSVAPEAAPGLLAVDVHDRCS